MSWSNEQKPSQVDTYLLKEDGDFLLLESGDKIILTNGAGSWTNDSK